MISGKTRGKRHITDVLFTLTLFAVFAAASLLVVFIGAEVYSATITRSDTSFELNTTISFVTTKIRQHDSLDAVRVDYIEGVSALVLSRDFGDAVFETWIYQHDGVLRELFMDREHTANLWLGAGQALVSVYYFSFYMVADGLVQITAKSSDGIYARSFVSIKSGRFF